MPAYLSPAVYIEETESGPQPIQGVSTSTAGFIGMAERGPLVPMLCTSPSDYAYWFGGLTNIEDFTDSNNPPRAHCYLPYAVQGFFNNGGQLCYVLRVVPDTATNAHRYLYNRGNPGDLSTTLVVTANQGSGTALLPPPIAALDATGVTATTTLRIGDGSASEYLPVAATAQISHSVVVNQPLSINHNSGISIAFQTINTTSGGDYLAADAAAGDTAITVLDMAGVLSGANCFEIGTGGVTEIVQLSPTGTIAQIGTTKAYSVPLQTPLAQDHTAGTPISVLTLNAATSTPLTATASAGDVLLFTNDPTLPTLPFVVEIDSPANATYEVRAAGQFAEYSITQPANDDWQAGSLIASVAFGGGSGLVVATTQLTADVSTGGRVIALANRTAVNVGTVLQLGTAPTEYATVVAVNGTRGLAPDPGSVVLSAPLDFSYSNGSSVQVLPPPAGGTTPLLSTTLAANSLVGASSIQIASAALTNTAAVFVGSVVVIDKAPNPVEYAVVTAIDSPSPGYIELSQPLQSPHSATSSIVVFPSPAMSPAARLIFDVAADSSTLIVTSNTLAPGNLVSVMTPDNEVTYHTISAGPGVAVSPPATPPNFTPTQITFQTPWPLQRTHHMGSPVVAREPLFTVQALDAGEWGRRLWVSVQDEQPGLVAQAQVTGIAGLLQLTLSTLTGVEPGSYLELFYPGDGTSPDLTPLKVKSINRSNTTVDLDSNLTGTQVTAINNALTIPNSPPIAVRSREFCLTVMLYQLPNPAIPSRNQTIQQSEVFHFLSMDPRHSHYIETVIGATDGPVALEDNRPKGSSMLVRVKDTATTAADQQVPRLGPEPLIDQLPGGLTQPARFQLDQDGDDAMSAVGDALYVGVDDPEPANRRGIPALRNVPDISIVAIPGQGTQPVQSALISHCENLLYRIAVLDPMTSAASLADIQAQRQAYDTKYAALYYPWLSIPDPFPDNLSNIGPFPIPPSGHVAGIYSRVDEQRGVYKAPANEVVQGISDLTRKLYKGEQDVLNPSPVNINVIRDFRADDRGIRVWGARCITSDTDYMYVSTRRLMMFIEQSIDLGLQWAVFEPNGPPLWSRITRSVTNFLTDVWRSGALQGTKASQAFFVECGPNTMTPTDMESGRLIVVVGVAPVYPAEFVIIRIGLMTATNGS